MRSRRGRRVGRPRCDLGPRRAARRRSVGHRTWCVERRLHRHRTPGPRLRPARLGGARPLRSDDRRADGRTAGLADEQIKFELFASNQPGRAAKKAASRNAAASAPVTAAITLDGSTRSVTLDRNTSVLEAALDNAMDAPWSCRAGVCSTCRCRVIEGEVEMAANHALEDDEVAKGFVLSCQAYPLTDKLVVSYDE